MTLNVLISHAHAERPLAEAWRELLEAISGGIIAPWYSSDTSGGGGMRIGVEWRETLRQQIRDSRFVIAVLSPASRDRPWILWECGVMNGLAQERAAADGRPAAAIIPVVYSMSPGELGTHSRASRSILGTRGTGSRRSASGWPGRPDSPIRGRNSGGRLSTSTRPPLPPTARVARGPSTT